MIRSKQVSELTIEDIEDAVYVSIDTRFPKKVLLSDNTYELNRYEIKDYMEFSTEGTLDFIKRISHRIQELENPVIKDNIRGWVKYLMFWRIGYNKFVITDRHLLPIHEISGLEPFEFIPSKKT